jgi:hypothetical protein
MKKIEVYFKSKVYNTNLTLTQDFLHIPYFHSQTMASSWNNVDCRELIEYNLGMMMKVMQRSNDPKKQWKIESYQKALDNMYKIDRPVYTMRDLKNSKIAGASILEKIGWILNHKVNLPEVEIYIDKYENSVKKNKNAMKSSKNNVIDDVDSSEEDDWCFSEGDTDESVTQEVNETESNHGSESSNGFDYETDPRAVYLSTICHIEGQMYNYLDVNDSSVRKILKKFNKLRKKYKIVEF